MSAFFPPPTAPSALIAHWARILRRNWQRRQLRNAEFDFLFETAPDNEWVSVDCETTGLDTRRDEIISIGAVRIAGNRILASQRLELLVRPQGQVPHESVRIHRLRTHDVAQGLEPEQALRQLLHFIGSRPLVGYYLEFDVAMLNRIARPLLGIALPHETVEVSAMYYDYKFRQLPPYRQYDNADIDLRFDTLTRDLDLPQRGDAHNAINDAIMAALAFIKLRRLQAE